MRAAEGVHAPLARARMGVRGFPVWPPLSKKTSFPIPDKPPGIRPATEFRRLVAAVAQNF